MMKRRNRHALMSLAAAAVLFVLDTPASAQSELKICKAKTKTMGCALESGLGDVSAAARATAVAAGGPLPGKCQIDSPGITPVKKVTAVLGVTCDDPVLADTGDAMIALCKEAATSVRASCKTTCAKLDKVDPVTGDVVPETPCFQVVSRIVVTTETDQLGVITNEMGQDGCGLSCTASIVCVCDP
ncbi:MAG: hypothetical protein ABR587_04535 [Candidatus Binatia bacterium]